MKKILVTCILLCFFTAASVAQLYTPGEFYCNLYLKGSCLGAEKECDLKLVSPFFSLAEGYRCSESELAINGNDLNSVEKCNYTIAITGPGAAAACTLSLGGGTKAAPGTKDFIITITDCHTSTMRMYACNQGSLTITKIENDKVYGSFTGNFEETVKQKDTDEVKLTGNNAVITCSKMVLSHQ